ncbi:hypothetical protein [Haloferula sp.]|uniref:hypothetical protein n=1 Tax=Haloferula sp. TaxID=2497595 RepID=UPI003C759C94
MKIPKRHHDHIREELSTAKESLTHVSRHLDEECELSVLENGLMEATALRDTKREDAHKAGERIKEWFEETKDQVISRLEDLKTDIEIHRIEKDADRKEDHARDAMIVAAHALLEAEISLIEAIKARRLAIDVAG